ncbi:MAG: hypothetical protein QXO51_03065 [Halobacteria archaeon]
MKEILEKVKRGELTPEQAEAELKKAAEAPAVPTGLGGAPERVGQVVQYTPPDEHPMAFVAIVGFAVLHVLFDALTVLWVLHRFDQREASLWAAMAFFTLGLILTLYMKHFMPDEIVVKKRRWKYVTQKNEPWSVTK